MARGSQNHTHIEGAQSDKDQRIDQGEPMGPTEACAAAIGQREVHIDGMACLVGVAMPVGIMDMTSMHPAVIVRMLMSGGRVLIACQVHMQRTKRRQENGDAEQQAHNDGQAGHPAECSRCSAAGQTGVWRMDNRASAESHAR